jgi:alpha-beta hydrolase superfamily lysophospholipase
MVDGRDGTRHEDVPDNEGEAEGEDELYMEVYETRTEPEPDGGYEAVTMQTSRGDVTCRYYSAPDARRGAIWVGGVGGGFDTPARGLYPQLCSELAAAGIASLRVRYRDPLNLSEAVLDVLAGVGYLAGEGIAELALIGHSFGGAVVIQAGTASDSVRSVVTLATQAYGADVASELPEECALLLIHGADDTVLPPASSEFICTLAHEPKRLVILEHAGHLLDEAAEAVYREVRGELLMRLGG